MAIFSGEIKLMGYVVTHIANNICNGSIMGAQVSASTATTAPYIVTWSGTTGQTASTFDIINLCAGDYIATITDITGATGTTQITISAFTGTSLAASLTTDSCILDPNKTGVITVSDSTTKAPTYIYELRKDNKLIDTHYGNTSDTTHTFDNIENGMYTVTVIENNPTTYTETPAKSGCTAYNYNDNGTSYGWVLDTIINGTWENFVPWAPFYLYFAASWGPAITTGVEGIFDMGLKQDGEIDTNNPYVWLYTGTTSTRLTDTADDWYLGVSALTANEGDGNVGPDIARSAANIGKFYYEEQLNKFRVLYPTYNSLLNWVTYDPRINYGQPGNPIGISLTGATSGVTVQDLGIYDYTINASDVVILASTIYPDSGTLGKLLAGENANNSQYTGLHSLCSYNNYTWQMSFNSIGKLYAAYDDDTIGIVLASFRDDNGKYGPSDVTHTLSLQLNGNTGAISISDNATNQSYGFNKTTTTQFRNCNQCGTCVSADPDYGQTTLLTNNSYLTPLSAAGEWHSLASLRTKITRSGTTGEHFRIQFTETMGSGGTGGGTIIVGDSNPYNSQYEINFNLLDKTTWSGNSYSAYDSQSWLTEYTLCKYLGSRRIGVWENSQSNTSWYHLQFTGSPSQQHVEVPPCSAITGPSATVQITATTGTTAHIIQTSDRNRYTSSEPNVPKIKPRVNVSLQTIPLPTLTTVGLSRPNVKLSEEVGGEPTLSVYNTSQGGGAIVKFYFDGDNTDMLFGNMYAKFRIFPYITQLEEVATLPSYEAIFDTLPSYYEPSVQSLRLSGITIIPWSGCASGDSWEYIIRTSYLAKDKNSKNERWIDTASYPPKKYFSNTKDFYMAVVDNPPTPNLLLNNFVMPFTPPSMQIDNITVANMPETWMSGFSSSTYFHSAPSAFISQPLVSVNGVVQTAGVAGVAFEADNPYINEKSPARYPEVAGGMLQTGDYEILPSRGIRFFPETVQNGDILTVMYDRLGGSYTQYFTVPATISTTNTDMIYEENGYYYINLDKQSFGGVVLSINGLIQAPETTYIKVSDSKIQLMNDTTLYSEGDIIGLFYKTIYTIVGFTSNKEPQIPVTYLKDKPLGDTIRVKLFNNDGDLIDELTEIISEDFLGNIEKSFTLKPPAPGTYKYRVSITRQYPLLNGESVYTTTQTDIISFEISRDVFYSPSGVALINNLNPGQTTI